MENKDNNIQLDPHEEYTDGKYSVLSFSKEDDSFRRITCSQESVALIPFCTNGSSQIQCIYLSKYRDYLGNSDKFTCITGKVDKNESDSYYDVVESLISKELEIKDIGVNDIYFLGKIDHTVPFTKGYRCYGVDLTRHLDAPFDDVLGKTRTSTRNTIDKVRFSRVLNGDITDSLVLSSSLILLSYFQK